MKPTPAYDAWGGFLDDIHIYNQALSEGAICQLHHDPVPERLAAGNCSDGIDNDCDGLTDTNDPGCSGGYAGAANAEASLYGAQSMTASGLSNAMGLLLLPAAVVIFLRILRRRN